MTSALQRFGHFALALVAAGLLAPASGLAQIASPGSAGANSGNGSSGSSNTTISNPTFTQVESVSTVTGVTVSNPSTITAAPQVVTSIQTTLTTVVQSTTQLPIPSETAQAIVGTTSAPAATASVLVGAEAQQPTITINNQVTSIAALPGLLSPAISTSGSTYTVINSTGLSGVVTASTAGDSVGVSLGSGSSSIQIATTPLTQAAVANFAAYAIAAGLSPASIAIGAELAAVLIQLPPPSNTTTAPTIQAAVQSAQLLASVQGLAGAVNLANMELGITTINQVISQLASATVPDSTVLAITSSPAFTSIHTLLSTARGAM